MKLPFKTTETVLESSELSLIYDYSSKECHVDFTPETTLMVEVALWFDQFTRITYMSVVKLEEQEDIDTPHIGTMGVSFKTDDLCSIPLDSVSFRCWTINSKTYTVTIDIPK